MAARIIEKNGKILARYIPANSWVPGLAFYSRDEEFVQVGTWKYDAGKELLAHIHNAVERRVNRTQEVIFIRQGRIKASIFDVDETFVESFEAGAGDTIILLDCGHGYTVLENGTQVLEVKCGPYPGAEADRRRIEHG